MATTLHTGHCTAIHRMPRAEKERRASPVLSLLRAIPALALPSKPASDEDGPRDRAGIARRGASVYDDALSAELLDPIAVACARSILIEDGASSTVVDALERCELLDSLSPN